MGVGNPRPHRFFQSCDCTWHLEVQECFGHAFPCPVAMKVESMLNFFHRGAYD
jgi:hypothetical protein